MDRTDQVSAVGELLQSALRAAGTDAFLDQVLPRIRDVAGADVAAVIRPSHEGPALHTSVGTAVPAFAPRPAADQSRHGNPAPPEWSALGLTWVREQHLPGHAGDLVLGWNEPPVLVGPDLDSALDAVQALVDGFEARAALSDLTQRVNSAQQLASMGDYDWHIASDTNLWSDQLYRIYGYEPGSFNASYERFLSCLHPDDRERIQSVHQAAYGSGEPYQMMERIVRPDGEIRYLSSNGEVIRDAEGTPIRMRGTCIDVTERVLAESERERVSERFRGLVEAAPEAILVVDADSSIVQANPRATEILGADPASHSLGEILIDRAAVGRNVPAIGLDGRDLILDVTRAELSTGDDRGLTAIFLVDAVPRLEREAMAQRLGESQQRRRQAFEINDSVVQGLTSALYALEQEDVKSGERFLRRTLASARAMMDGLLEPRGNHLVAGDLIRTLPSSLLAVDPTGSGAEVGESPVLSGGASTNPRILIVDDAEDIRTLLRLKLGSDGRYHVVGEAVDGQDAVDQARALQPHLVLLDMAMPRMDGLQALPLIREAVPNVRVIVLSGFNQKTLEAEALAAGADRYIVKGGSMRDLLEAIATVLDAA